MFSLISLANAILVTDTTLCSQGAKYIYTQQTYENIKQQTEATSHLIFIFYIYRLFTGDNSFVLLMNTDNFYCKTVDSLLNHAIEVICKNHGKAKAMFLTDLRSNTNAMRTLKNRFSSKLQKLDTDGNRQNEYINEVVSVFVESLTLEIDIIQICNYIEVFIKSIYESIALIAKEEFELRNNDLANLSEPKMNAHKNSIIMLDKTREELLPKPHNICYIMLDISEFQEILTDLLRRCSDEGNTVQFIIDLSEVYIKSICVYLYNSYQSDNEFNYDKTLDYINQYSCAYLKKIVDALFDLKAKIWFKKARNLLASYSGRLFHSLHLKSKNLNSFVIINQVINSSNKKQEEMIELKVRKTNERIAKLEKIFHQIVFDNNYTELFDLMGRFDDNPLVESIII